MSTYIYAYKRGGGGGLDSSKCTQFVRVTFFHLLSSPGPDFWDDNYI